MDWILFLILTVNGQPEATVRVVGQNRYPSYERCVLQGQEFVEWLSQKKVSIQFNCYSQLKEAQAEQPQPRG